MTDIKRRTLRMWAEAEKQLSVPPDVKDLGDLGPLMGWADVRVELEILRELETDGGTLRLRESEGTDGTWLDRLL